MSELAADLERGALVKENAELKRQLKKGKAAARAALDEYSKELHAAFATERRELELRVAELERQLQESGRPDRNLDGVTLADMEALAKRVSSAVAVLREARPFLGVGHGAQGEPATSDSSGHETAPPAPPAPRPPPPAHPRSSTRLSASEQAQKEAWLRDNRDSKGEAN